MKLKYAVIATLVFSGQLAWADDAIDAAANAATPSTAVEPTTVREPAEKAATETQIRDLATDVSPSLQSKLDALMSFDAGPVDTSRQEVASAH